MAQVDNKTAVLYGALIGGIAGNLIPTAGDALYFYLSKKNRDAFAKGEMSATEYWSKEAIGYYTFNAISWALVLLIVANIKGDFKKKLNVALMLTGAGIVGGVIIKNIKEDKDKQAINQQKETIYKESIKNT